MFYVEDTAQKDFVKKLMDLKFPKINSYTFIYANTKNSKLKTKLKEALKSHHYFKFTILLDSDKDHFPEIIVSKKVYKKAMDGFIKKRKLEKFKEEIKPHIQIAISEVESWYLAGLAVNNRQSLKLKSSPKNTEDITKEQFFDLFPEKSQTQIEKRQLSLKHFDTKQALANNGSFRKFLNYLCQQLT